LPDLSVFFEERFRKTLPVKDTSVQYGGPPTKVDLSVFFKETPAGVGTTERPARKAGTLQEEQPTLPQMAKRKVSEITGAGKRDIREMVTGLPPALAQLADLLMEPDVYPFQKFEKLGELGKHIGKEELGAYKKLVRHPIRSFEEHPVYSLMRLLPVTGAMGMAGRLGVGAKIAEKLGKVSPLLERTFLRPFATQPELQTLFRQQRGGVGLGRLQAREMAESLYAGWSPAERLRLGQIMKGSITKQPEFLKVTQPVKQLREELATGLRKRGLLSEETFLTKLPRKRVAELNRKEAELLTKMGKLWEHRRFPGQADRLRKELQKVRDIRTKLYHHYHYGGWAEYMPREYLKHLENKTQILQFLSPKKYRIKTPWQKGRKDIPEEIRIAMGEVLEPAYPMYNAISRESRAIATYDLFQDLAKNPKWVWDGKGKLPEGWIQVNKTENLKSLGDLAGKYVRPDVAEEIGRMARVMGKGEQFYQKSLSLWKAGKVLPRAGTHLRNIYNNLIFADFAGLSPFKPTTYKWLLKGIQEIRNRGEAYTQLVKEGFLGTEYYGQEILPAFAKYLKSGKQTNLYDTMADIAKGGFNKLGEIYQMEDQVFKVAIYMKHRAKGRSMAEALAEVDKWMPNYAEVPGVTRFLRTSPIGAPFFSFKSEAIRIAKNAAQEHPLKLAFWMMLPGMITDMSAKQMGLNDKQVAELEKQLPEYAKTGMYALIPSDKKKPRWLDLTYVMFLGDLTEVTDPRDLMAHPVFATAFAIATKAAGMEGRKLYSGGKITRPGMTLQEETGAWLDYIWKMAAPSNPLVPGSFDYDKIRRAYLEKRHPVTGEVPSKKWTLLDVFGGLRTKTFGTTKQQKKFYLIGKKRRIEDLVGEIYRTMSRKDKKDMTHDEKMAKVRQLLQEIQKVQREPED